jgi:hypothetical protein
MERGVAVEQALAHLPLMLTVEQTCEVLGIGRSLAYAQARRYLATQGREGIPAVRIGTALRIPRTGLVDLLLSTPAPAPIDATVLRVVPTPEATRPSKRRTRGSASFMPELPFASSD